MGNIAKNIQNFAHQNSLWKDGSKILIGVSGGPDSVFLLDILSKMSPKYNLTLHIAHVNYGLRGKDSDLDEKFVRNLAEKYGIKISALNAKRRKISKNLEGELRDIRYDFFEKIRKDEKMDFIATAHNKDDQAETVLMNILRGSGLTGIKAMKPRTGNVIRPLLKTSRKEIEKYLKENKLQYRFDITNKDISFTRNKIRNRLIPYLEKNYNSEIKDSLLSLSLTVSDDYELIHLEAIKSAEKVTKRQGSELYIDLKKFNLLHPSIQREVLRISIKAIRISLKEIKLSHIEEVEKIIKSTKSKTQKIEFLDLKITKKNDKIIMLQT